MKGSFAMPDPPALVAWTPGWTPGWTAGVLASVVGAGRSMDASATNTNTSAASNIIATVFQGLRVRIASFIVSPFARTNATPTTMAPEARQEIGQTAHS